MTSPCSAANCDCPGFQSSGKRRTSGVGAGGWICTCGHIENAHIAGAASFEAAREEGRTRDERRMMAQGLGCIVFWLAVVGIVVFAIVSGGGDDGGRNAGDSGTNSSSGRSISRADFGDEWPFSVSSGRLECRNGGEVVFTSGGVSYGINGTARGTGSYAEIDPIWLPDPEIEGYNKSVGPVLDAGLELCD